MTVPTADATRIALVALSGLSGLGPIRLSALLDAADGDPGRAWALVRAGLPARVPVPGVTATRATVVADWRAAARAVDLDDVAEQHRRAGVRILLPSDPTWPPALLDGPDPPRVLFARGDVDLLTAISVAVIGTRRCTAAGAAIARGFGRDLGAAGVPVVSGLALGIDGAAHRGVLDAGGAPVGVVGTGLDHCYPVRHRALWDAVGDAGVLCSEYPLGTPPERWRFPARNRIIAALACALVVVESDRRGGSMTTVDAALSYGTDVFAVPGPVRSPQSTGTNQLLHDGSGFVRDAADLLAALGSVVWAPSVEQPTGIAAPGAASPEDEIASDPRLLALGDGPAAVAAVLSAAPASVEEIAEVTGRPFAEIVVDLARLEAATVACRVPEGYRLARP